jgi:hypothetical protein
MTLEELRAACAEKMLEIEDIWPLAKCPYEFTLVARHRFAENRESDFLVSTEKDLDLVIASIEARKP